MRLRENKNLTTSKRERRKNLNKFKDVAKNCFGKPTTSGIGDGYKLFCPICINPIRSVRKDDGLWYCKECGSLLYTKQ